MQLRNEANSTLPRQRKVNALRNKLNAIYTNRAELTLLRLQRISYDQGNKVGSHLARQLRLKREKKYIGDLLGEGGRTFNVDAEKANMFIRFYASLNRAENVSKPVTCIK